MMIILPMHTKIECTDSPGGRLIAVIIDPARQDVTHLVVHFLDEKYLVPSEYLAGIKGQLAYLHCSQDELRAMGYFAEKLYIRSTHPATPNVMAYPVPQGVPLYSLPTETDHLLTEVLHPPAGKLALHDGASVWATDGPMGRVRELYISDDRHHHILRVGMEVEKFLRAREIVVPLTAVERFENDVVCLKWDQRTIEQLASGTH